MLADPIIVEIHTELQTLDVSFDLSIGRELLFGRTALVRPASQGFLPCLINLWTRSYEQLIDLIPKDDVISILFPDSAKLPG